MRFLCLLILPILLLAASPAAAAPSAGRTPTVDPCAPPAKKPPPPRRPPPKRPERPKTPEKPCACPPGERGPEGPKGPPGEKGETLVVFRYTTPPDAGIALGLGVMGSAYPGPKNSKGTDWAWGPALELAVPLGEARRDHLRISLGSASFATAGRESGYLARAAFSRRVTNRFDVLLGAHLTSIRGSDSNGEVDGRYAAAIAGVGFRAGVVRLEVAPAIGLLTDGAGNRNRLSVGLTGQAMAGWSW